MQSVEIKAISHILDPKTATIVYETDQGPSRPGILVLSDAALNRDLLIVNQYYSGEGPVKVVMRPFRAPARKYEDGEVIARLIFI